MFLFYLKQAWIWRTQAWISHVNVGLQSISQLVVDICVWAHSGVNQSSSQWNFSIYPSVSFVATYKCRSTLQTRLRRTSIVEVPVCMLGYFNWYFGQFGSRISKFAPCSAGAFQITRIARQILNIRNHKVAKSGTRIKHHYIVSFIYPLVI